MKTKYLAILLCAAFVLPGCNDSFLDRIPLDELTDETYWETEEHLILASNACINYLRGKSRSVDMEFLGDNVFRERSSEYKTLGSGNFTSDLSVINSEWTTDYDGIRRCNHFLENYERAQKVSAPVRERYAGEAIFIRAYLYSYLVNCFGDVPRVTNTIDVGDDELYGSRTDKETMIEWILDEFDRAAAVLPYAKDLKDSELGRPTKEAAWAFSSRFALYHERWDKAVSSAEEVMTAGFHKLYDNGNPETTYNELFTLAANPVTNKNNREFIVTRLYSEEANQTHNLSRELQVPNEEARYAPTRSLMDAYLCNGLPITLPASRYRENTHEAIFNNRDPRMAQTILKPGAKWGGYPGKTTYEQPKFSNSATSCRTTTGWYFTKFVELSAISRYNKDQNAIPLMRYAEVLLNWIEAKEMRGDAITQPDIDKSINLLRDRVGADKMVLTKLNAYGLNLRDEIRRERRVELALEGGRYFDLLRWKQGDLLAKDVTGMRKSTVPPSEYVYVEDIPTDDKGNLILMTGRTFSDMKNYLWPIPFTQTQRNPNLLPNNPGWE